MGYRGAAGARPAYFVAQSPANYYPPAIMTYVAMPQVGGSTQTFKTLATSAIRRAAQNYGGTAAARLVVRLEEARYGVLEGFEATFDGVANGEEVQIRVFVRHTPGRFPIAMQIYSLRGKLTHLSEPIRRAWTNVRYLK